MSKIDDYAVELMSKYPGQVKFRAAFSQLYQEAVATLRLSSEKLKAYDDAFWKEFLQYLQGLNRSYNKTSKTDATKRMFFSDVSDFLDKREDEGYFQTLKIQAFEDQKKLILWIIKSMVTFI